MYIPGLVIVIFVFTCLFGAEINGLINFIKRKETLGIVCSLLSFPFLIFMLSAFLLGGGPFNNAETEYELYQMGHYYLESHNVYTEVTKSQYVYMQIIEVVGLGTFALDCILRLVFKNKSKKTDKQA